MSLLTRLQSGMALAVQLLNQIGTTAVFTPKATGTAVNVKVLIRELSTEELVGDYRQGDLKIEMDASEISDPPKKYDTLAIGTREYAVQGPSGAERRLGDEVYTYKFIVRGG